jgi:hypothetical protein
MHELSPFESEFIVAKAGRAMDRLPDYRNPVKRPASRYGREAKHGAIAAAN